jgi:hypothetical protein
MEIQFKDKQEQLSMFDFIIAEDDNDIYQVIGFAGEYVLADPVEDIPEHRDLAVDFIWTMDAFTDDTVD